MHVHSVQPWRSSMLTHESLQFVWRWNVAVTRYLCSQPTNKGCSDKQAPRRSRPDSGRDWMSAAGVEPTTVCCSSHAIQCGAPHAIYIRVKSTDWSSAGASRATVVRQWWRRCGGRTECIGDAMTWRDGGQVRSWHRFYWRSTYVWWRWAVSSPPSITKTTANSLEVCMSVFLFMIQSANRSWTHYYVPGSVM